MSNDAVVEVRGRPRPSLETHFVVPAGIDDPSRPSGGNRYDRRVIDALRDLGRSVQEHQVGDLDGVLAGLPDGAVVVVDGLIGSFAPELLVPAAARLRIVVLLHMPFAEAFTEESVRRGERAALAAAAGVVTTSDWSRDWVIRNHGLAPERVRTARPGVDPAPATSSTGDGGRLLCLAAVTRAKGHDVLLSALAEIADLDWYCTCAGALDLEPDFAAGLQEIALRSGISDRVRFTGPIAADGLRSALADADLLVSASRGESYGMTVTEAFAHALPVLVTDVGGHPEAVGLLSDGTPAGVLVPPDDPDLLAAALRRWLESRGERERLRSAAARRRETLDPWTTTARRLADAVDAMAMNPAASRPVSPDTTTAGR